jgi:hypothetical protein
MATTAGGALAGNGGHATRSLDAAEVATLKYMREEEKLARDVYLTFYGIYGETVFRNIMESEQKHFDTMGKMIAKYGVDDPATPDVAGTFTNPDLQALYNQLTARGAEGLKAALRVGGLIEETDMDDLAAAIDESDQRDLDRAYTNLRDGSKNHLSAFVANLEATGEEYEAQYLSQNEVEDILEEVESSR